MGKTSKTKKIIKDSTSERHVKQRRHPDTLKSTRTHPQESNLHRFSQRSLLMFLVIVLLSFAVYFNALFNGFVYDDELQVLENPWIKDVRNLPDIFSKPSWSFIYVNAANYYRPLMHVIYMLNYYIFGLKSWGFHLVNILFHVANSILILIIGNRLLIKSSTISVHKTSPFFSIPFFTAILFAVHPIHTEAVVWIGGITDLSFTFFVLLSFYFYIKSGASMISNNMVLSVSSFFLALLCKEPAVMLLGIFMLYDFAFREGKNEISICLKKYVPFLVILGIYFIIRYHALGQLIPEKAYDMSSFQYIGGMVDLFAKYLNKLILPIDLNAFYALPTSVSFDLNWIFSLVAVILFVIVSVIAIRRNRYVFFGLAVIAVPLFIPILFFQSIGGGAVFAERYLYLPSLGFVLLVSVFFVWVRGKFHQYNFILITALTILVSLYSFQTISRNRVWKDMITLCMDIIKKSPNAELPRGNLGNALLDGGRVDEAIDQFQTIISKIDPNSENAYYNIGRALKKKGLFKDAITAFQKAVSLNPNDLDARLLLAGAYAKSGMIDKALQEYGTLKGWEPNSPLTFTKFGNELEKEGLADEAIQQYKKALTLNPNFAASHYHLALAYQKSGQLDQALKHMETLVRIQPNESSFQNLLGIVYEQRGLNDKAIEQFQLAVKLAPTEPSYRQNLDKALAQKLH